MQLFSREKPKAKANAHEPEHKPLDPVALCLALWLGSMVCAFGLIRMMNDAAMARHNADNLYHETVPMPAIHPTAAGG